MEPATQSLVGGGIQTLMGLAVSTGFLLALFVGFCVVAGLTKFRRIGRGSLVFRNLVDQMDGAGVRYLTPDAPSGQADQLRTPELLEQTGESAETGASRAGQSSAS